MTDLGAAPTNARLPADVLESDTMIVPGSGTPLVLGASAWSTVIPSTAIPATGRWEFRGFVAITWDDSDIANKDECLFAARLIVGPSIGLEAHIIAPRAGVLNTAARASWSGTVGSGENVRLEAAAALAAGGSPASSRAQAARASSWLVGWNLPW